MNKSVKRLLSLAFYVAALFMWVTIYDAGLAILSEKGILTKMIDKVKNKGVGESDSGTTN